MAINNAILDAGPTISRAEVKTVIGKIYSNMPEDGNLVVVVQPDGTTELVVEQSDPSKEGQMVFVENSEDFSVIPLIAVLAQTKDAAPGDPTGLLWKRLDVSGFTQDPRTGQPKDPLYDLY